MARGSRSDKTSIYSGKKAPSPSQKHAQRQRASARKDTWESQEPEQTTHILDDRTRRDIAGVVCVVCAIILALIAFSTTNGLITRWLSDSVHLGLGVGAYVLPLILILIGVSLFVRREGEQMPTRIAIGLVVLFLSILTLVSLFTPGASPQTPQALFTRQYLVSQGGYVGAGIAWVLLVLFGREVSTVICVGMIVIGLLIIGVSVRTFVAKIQKHREQVAEEDEQQDFRNDYRAPSAFIKRTPDKPSLWKRAVQSHRGSSGKTEVFDNRAADELDQQTGFFKGSGSGDADSAGEGKTQIIGSGSSSATSASSNASSDLRHQMASKALTRRLGHKTTEDQADPSKTQILSPAAKRDARQNGLTSSSGVSGAKPVASTGNATSRGAVSEEPKEGEEGFRLPDIGILRTSPKNVENESTKEELRDTAALLQETLADFGVNANVVGWVAGPTVTLFKIDLPAGVRVSRVMNLQDDIALALAAQGVRIFAPIPGTNYVGIEVPNVKRQDVLLGDVLPSAKKGPLQMAIGKDVEGHCIVADLAKMPHLLIGGTTGSGKSVAMNSMVMSILMRSTPDQVRFIMIDPKRVEFAPYNDIPNLYVPVVTETKEAASALSWAVAEMERRLTVFSKVAARNIEQYNKKVDAGEAGGEGPEGAQRKLPYIVIVIDELADLMMNVGKEVEFSISRLAQLGRAAGIHMIVATQRPSANVVTGLIKANITNRIAFNVASGTDSRVILDQTGAEHLIGNGDLLFSRPQYPKPVRIQGCFVSEAEIEATMDQLKAQGEPDYHNEILQTRTIGLGDTDPMHPGADSSDEDPLLWEAADLVVGSKIGSTSNLQRRLKVGYSRAGRIMDMLEDKGVVGPQNGSKPREVLVDELELESIKAFERNDQAENR